VTLTRISGSKEVQRRAAGVARKGEKTGTVEESEPALGWNSAGGVTGLSLTFNDTTDWPPWQFSPDFLGKLLATLPNFRARLDSYFQSQ
jgi:hypothetical protein